MTKYETVIKALSQVDHNTLEIIAREFFKTYDYGYFLKYEDSERILYDLIKYFPERCIEIYKDETTYTIFAAIIETSHLKEEQYNLIRWNKNTDNFDENSLSILNIAKCSYCCCEECNDCCYESIFFIEEFYNYCLNQNFVKVLIEEIKVFDGETKKIKEKEKEERKEKNMDNLRTIAEKLVDNFDEYEEIIYKLRDVGVSDEKIYNIFYEILKDINE